MSLSGSSGELKLVVGEDFAGYWLAIGKQEMDVHFRWRRWDWSDVVVGCSWVWAVWGWQGSGHGIGRRMWVMW